VLAIVGSRVIRRWRLNDGQVIEPDLVLGTRPWDVSIGYGGSDINDTQLMTLVSVASDPAMVIAGDVRGWLWGWSFRTGTLEFQCQVHLGAIGGLAVMNREPSGALISAGATDGYITILEPPGKEVATIDIGSPIVSVASVGEDIIVATPRGWVALRLGDV